HQRKRQGNCQPSEARQRSRRRSHCGVWCDRVGIAGSEACRVRVEDRVADHRWRATCCRSCGYSFSSGVFVAPTIGALTAPSPAPAKPAEPAKPARNAPVQAVSGDEAKRRMAAVNARRDIDYQIMTEPSRVAGETQPSLGNEP